MTDYISRKTAYQFFKDQLEEETGAYRKGRNAELRVVMSAVMNNDAIPAADVRPVRRGKWNIVKLPPDPGYKAKECSSCKCNFWDLEEWNFCPNCGADMREDMRETDDEEA